MAKGLSSQKYNGARRKVEIKQVVNEEVLKMPVDTTNVPPEKVWACYGLDQPTCTRHNAPNAKPSKCRDNPYCISRLGLEKFEKLIKDSEKDKLSKERDAKRREPNQPCGLTNTGNFCYVNSFLQVWYNDLVFRQIVYDWRPSDKYEKPDPPLMDVQGVMNSLQELFFTLQTSPYEDCASEEFCKTLRLGNEQQDAQEFTLMFFDALDRNLAKHPNGEETRLRIQERLRGQYTHSHVCGCSYSSNKPTNFTSLAISIDGHNTLTKAIKAYCAPEDISDYRCSSCNEMGGVVKTTTMEHLPPVLLISLNRYVYDRATGRRRKVKTAIQYPRELDPATLFDEFRGKKMKYELCAVMVHEGDNAECGHYLDLVKHPEDGAWFKYNDDRVSLLNKPPGVDIEKPDVSNNKATVDLKYCYGLVYRQVEKKIRYAKMGMPPPEITKKWEESIERGFIRSTGARVQSSELCLEEVKSRYDTVSDLFGALELKSEKASQKKAKDMAFLPTALIEELLAKEYDRAAKVKETLKGVADDMDTTQESLPLLGDGKEEEEEDVVSSPSRRSRTRRRVRSLFDRRIEKDEVAGSLSVHSLHLCSHGNLPIDEILDGNVKAVSKSAAESLLSNYGLVVTMEQDGEEGTVQSGRLKTGLDVCESCVVGLIHAAHRKRKLEEDAALAAKIHKEFKTRCSMAAFFKMNKKPPSGWYYVSKSQLLSWKRDAVSEDERKKSILSANCARLSISSSLNSAPVTNGHRQRRKRVLSDKNEESADEEESVSNMQKKCARVNVKDEQDKQVIDIMMSQITDRVSSDEPMDVEREGSEKKEGSEEKERSGSGSPIDRPTSSFGDEKEEDETGEGSSGGDDDEPVYFNRHLQCDHDGVNIGEFRHAVSSEEWKRLTEGYFERIFEVPVDSDICVLCADSDAVAQTDKREIENKLKELNAAVGEVLRSAEKRMGGPAIGEKEEAFQYGLCSRFVGTALKALRSCKTATSIPRLCQDCVLCDDHALPRFALIPICDDNQLHIIPLTVMEWTRVVSAWPDGNRAEEIILDDDGMISSQCIPCHEALMSEEQSKKFVYNNQIIYVKMRSDEETPPESVESKASTTNGASQSSVMGTRTNGTRAATRRGMAKNLHKVKMSSTDTVKQLKQKLYPQVHYAPVDQLLYTNAGKAMDDEMTLAEARVEPDNVDRPVMLVVQTTKSDGPCASNEPRALERGFTDTALAH